MCTSGTAGGDDQTPREGETRLLYTRRYAATARLASCKPGSAPARRAGACIPRHAPPPAGPSEMSARARHAPETEAELRRQAEQLPRRRAGVRARSEPARRAREARVSRWRKHRQGDAVAGGTHRKLTNSAAHSRTGTGSRACGPKRSSEKQCVRARRRVQRARQNI